MRKKIILTLLIAVMLLPAIALAGRPQPGDKGSLKNKLAILSVEAPGWQDAKTQLDRMHRRLKCKVIFKRALNQKSGDLCECGQYL